jgi:hypothetical protein
MDRPKVLDTRKHDAARRFRHSMDMRDLWRHVEHEIRYLGDLDAKSGKTAILLYIRPKWWLRVLGLGGWAEQRALDRALLILRRQRPDTRFRTGGKA